VDAGAHDGRDVRRDDDEASVGRDGGVRDDDDDVDAGDDRDGTMVGDVCVRARDATATARASREG